MALSHIRLGNTKSQPSDGNWQHSSSANATQKLGFSTFLNPIELTSNSMQNSAKLKLI